MILKMTDLDQFAGELKQRKVNRVFASYGYTTDEQNKQITLTIIISAEVHDTLLIEYSEHVGICASEEKEIKELNSKGHSRKIELSDILIDKNIKMNDGWFE